MMTKFLELSFADNAGEEESLSDPFVRFKDVTLLAGGRGVASTRALSSCHTPPTTSCLDRMFTL